MRLKGQLLCLLIDLKIRSLTNNQKSLDDVVIFIKSWFADQNKHFSDEDLLHAINSVSSIDLTSFFDLHINGCIEMPIAEVLESAGIFVESKTDTIPDLGQVKLSDDTNEIIKLTKDGPLDFAGMKIGDELLSLNNQKFRGNYILSQVIDTLNVGSQVEMTVKREGLSLMLSTKVPGKKVDAFNLKSFEPQTNLQATIRKTWLSGTR